MDNEKFIQDNQRNRIRHGASRYGMHGFCQYSDPGRDVIRWIGCILLRIEDGRQYERREIMRIYISGPITNNPHYIEDFYEKEEELEQRGIDVINPVRVDDAFRSLKYEEYIQLDLLLLEMCDAIYMLTGWQNSQGASLEREYARIMGKEIIYQ